MESNLLSIVAYNVKRIRLSQKISQEELAFRCDISKNYLSDLERGKRNITIKILEKLLNGLKVEAKQLFEEPK